MEQWATTFDRRVAIAIGTLGAVVRVFPELDERTGKKTIRYDLSLTNLEGDLNTRLVIARFNSGALDREEPAHPFLTVLRGMENRFQLLELARKGTCMRLVQVPGTEVWQYVQGGGEGLPGARGQIEVIETGDLKMAAALGVAGLPVLAITGSGRDFKFYLPRFGPVRPGGLPPVDGVALRAAWWEDKSSVPWSEPFAQAARGLFNRERLLDAEHRGKLLVLLRKPQSTKAVAIHEEATDAAWDIAKRALQ